MHKMKRMCLIFELRAVQQVASFLAGLFCSQNIREVLDRVLHLGFFYRELANGITEVLAVYRSAVLQVEQSLMSDSVSLPQRHRAFTSLKCCYCHYLPLFEK